MAKKTRNLLKVSVKLNQDERKKRRPMALVDFDLLTEKHFVTFILSLTKSGGRKPVYSTYNVHRASFAYLFTIFSRPKPVTCETELVNFNKE
jgi:hypothetical protein